MFPMHKVCTLVWYPILFYFFFILFYYCYYVVVVVVERMLEIIVNKTYFAEIQ